MTAFCSAAILSYGKFEFPFLLKKNNDLICPTALLLSLSTIKWMLKTNENQTYKNLCTARKT